MRDNMRDNKKHMSLVSILLFLLIFFFFVGFFNEALDAADDFIIAMDDYSRIYYAKGMGDGTFSDYGYLDYLGGYYSRGLTINDFDNDGDLDFIAGRGISDMAYYYLFLNEGSGHFIRSSMAGTLSGVNSWAMDMASGDFDNDGYMDFIANGNERYVGLYLGDGNGGFRETVMDLGYYGRGLDVADFDNDGNLDFVRGGYSSGYIHIYWGDGTGAFPGSLYIGDAGDDPYGVVAGDFTNDGHIDIIANFGGNGDPYLWKGNGDRTFAYSGYIGTLDLENYGCYDAFDFDRDGNLDIVAVNYSGNRVYYYQGNGDGTFGAPLEIGVTIEATLGVSAPPMPPTAGTPTADIMPATQTINKGDTAGLDGSGSLDPDGSLSSWVWDFGDGSPSESGSGAVVGTAGHIYANEGRYIARLKVTDNDGKSDYAAAVVIVKGDTPDIDMTPITLGEALSDEGIWNLSLDAADYATDSEGIAAYQWDLGDGYSDDFEDGTSNGWHAFAGTWAVENSSPIAGSFSFRQSDIGLNRAWTLFDKVYDTDIIIDADIYMISGSGEEAQIIFRAMNFQNNYEYILRGRGSNDILLYKWVNGSASSLFEYDLPSSFPSYPIDTGFTYHVRIVCTGPRIDFYLDGYFLFTYYDSTFSTGKVGFSTYYTDALFDNLTVTATGAGQTVHHAFAPGTYNIDLTVTDAAGQITTGTIPVTMQPGDPPVADAGGPYSADESAAREGGWTFGLDGSGSFDDLEIGKYIWDLGQDTFDGASFQSEKWYTNSGIAQNDNVSLTGISSWGTRYMVTKAAFPKVKGQTFMARIMATGDGHCMFGFKDINSTNFSYEQFPYEFYLYNGSIYIYENSYSRGYTGYGCSYNTWYDFKIELKDTGAVYSYRQSGTSAWFDVYNSDYVTDDTTLRKGMVVYSSTFCMDDFLETTAGLNPDFTLYHGTGTFAGTLTVYDRAGQSDTDSFDVIITANDIPNADAGPDQTRDETGAVDGSWTVNFDASGSSDDYGIYMSEWDWENDGTFDYIGVTATHSWTGTGTYTVALRVTDHALQSTIDTAKVSLTTGDPPTAEAGGDITTEGHWPVVFNAGNSSDDFGIYKYEWDFGDGTTGKGKTPTHIYWSSGDYEVTLTVYDNALQSDSYTLAVHCIAGADFPKADAGGPYNAGEGGPPAYFNGSGSTDDYGVVKYLWDIDDKTDSDGDGDFTNDMDVVGRKPFYTYPYAGTYTATLTVVDGAGQTDTATATVNVAINLAPDVICVPWRAAGPTIEPCNSKSIWPKAIVRDNAGPTIPHETCNGKSIRLKAIVRDKGDLTCQWRFGDASAPYPATPAPVTDKYAIEVSHIYPDSADGTPYTATLTVWDSNGLAGMDNYYVIVRPDNLDTRTNIAIDEGLWWLHKSQSKSDGHWASYGAYYASPTASAIQAFEINGHLQDGDNQENPYVETVNKGFEYLFTALSSYNIGAQASENPDTNLNGIGIGVYSDRPVYEGGMVMDAIASSNAPLAFAITGGADIKGRFYYHILTDMVDMYAWGQYDNPAVGGWRYGWNEWPDNSACQWAAIGMLAAEDNFGINVPQWVKERNNNWLSYSYDGTGFGYTGPGNGVATTPSGMVQLAFCDKYTTDPRWRTAEDFIANNWYWQDNNYYGAYALVKALRLALPNPVVNLSATGLDWYNDPATGVRKRIVEQQNSLGYWDVTFGAGFSTAWGIIMLTPTLFVQPPVADAGDDIIWAYDMELTFDASGSFHMDPARCIVLYEWDFDGDGTWDFYTSDPSDANARYTYPDPDPNTSGDLPQTFTARLRVTDDNDPPQSDIDTREVTVAEPPHAPFAVHGGPYKVTAGIPFILDGGGSYDIDSGDGVSRYQWDLDNDGVWFDDVDLDTRNASATWTYSLPGIYHTGLKVWDKGAFNPIGCQVGIDCGPMESIPVYTTVIASPNMPPKADAGGHYLMDEGATLTLDGSGSHDENGDALSWLWDLDNDGEYDDASGVAPATTFNDNGTYIIGLKVSDTLLEDTDSTTVTVNDLAPAAGFRWSPELPSEGSAVMFTDTSASYPDTIKGWSWNFGGLGTSTDRNPGFTFMDNGIYTVTLTVTDDDGSTDTVSHQVTVLDLGPTAILDIRIVDDVTSDPLVNALVMLEDIEGNWMTGADGWVRNIVAPSGGRQAYVWREHYLPKAEDLRLYRGFNSVEVRLLPGEVLEVEEVKSTPLTFEEIVKRGVDLKDPNNYWVYDFEVKLAVAPVTIPNVVLPQDPAPGITYPLCTGTCGSYGGYQVGGTVTYIRPKPGDPVYPVYTFIIIPGEIKLLKEFFNVSARIKNNAPVGSIFDIIDTTATLLYPADALTLVDLSGAPQDLTKPVGPGGTIAAGAEEGVDWVLRGDKEGHHTVTVNVNGTLIPFNIDLQAANSGVVDVYGKPELETLFIVKDPVWPPGGPYLVQEGHDFTFIIKLTNKSPIPVYMVSAELFPERFVNAALSAGEMARRYLVPTNLDPNQTGLVSFQITSLINGFIIPSLSSAEGDPLLNASLDIGGSTGAFAGFSSSPVDLRIIDPQGRVLDKNTGEIPDASYVEVDFGDDGHVNDQFYIPHPVPGTYHLRVYPEAIAHQGDTYNLDVWYRERWLRLAHDTPVPAQGRYDEYTLVSGPEPDNVAPVADPGGPYLGAVGSDITLDGSGSYDENSERGTNPLKNPLTPSGYDEIVFYQWDLDEDGLYGAEDTPAEPEGMIVTVNFGTFIGTKRVRLKVTDSFGKSPGQVIKTATVAVSDLYPIDYELISRTYNRVSRKWTLAWKVYIKNVENGEAYNVSARLTPSSIPPEVTISDDQVAWSGTIVPGETRISDDEFRYTYTSEDADLTRITWDIVFTDALGRSHKVQSIPQ